MTDLDLVPNSIEQLLSAYSGWHTRLRMVKCLASSDSRRILFLEFTGKQTSLTTLHWWKTKFSSKLFKLWSRLFKPYMWIWQLYTDCKTLVNASKTILQTGNPFGPKITSLPIPSPFNAPLLVQSTVDREFFAYLIFRVLIFPVFNFHRQSQRRKFNSLHWIGQGRLADNVLVNRKTTEVYCVYWRSARG